MCHLLAIAVIVLRSTSTSGTTASCLDESWRALWLGVCVDQGTNVISLDIDVCAAECDEAHAIVLGRARSVHARDEASEVVHATAATEAQAASFDDVDEPISERVDVGPIAEADTYLEAILGRGSHRRRIPSGGRAVLVVERKFLTFETRSESVCQIRSASSSMGHPDRSRMQRPSISRRPIAVLGSIAALVVVVVVGKGCGPEQQVAVDPVIPPMSPVQLPPKISLLGVDQAGGRYEMQVVGEDHDGLVPKRLTYTTSGGERQLIADGVLLADFSPSSALVAYWTADYRLTIVRDQEVVATIADAGWPRVSPTGGKVVFVRYQQDVSSRPGFAAEHAIGLQLLDVRDGSTIALTDSSQDFAPFWLDDRWVAFGSGRTENPANTVASLWLVSVDHSVPVRLTNKNIESASDPAFIPIPSEYPAVSESVDGVVIDYPSDDTHVHLVVDLTKGSVTAVNVTRGAQ